MSVAALKCTHVNNFITIADCCPHQSTNSNRANSYNHPSIKQFTISPSSVLCILCNILDNSSCPYGCVDFQRVLTFSLFTVIPFFMTVWSKPVFTVSPVAFTRNTKFPDCYVLTPDATYVSFSSCQLDLCICSGIEAQRFTLLDWRYGSVLVSPPNPVDPQRLWLNTRVHHWCI